MTIFLNDDHRKDKYFEPTFQVLPKHIVNNNMVFDTETDEYESVDGLIQFFLNSKTIQNMDVEYINTISHVLKIIFGNISINSADDNNALQIKIQARMTASRISFKIFDNGQYFDPDHPAFLLNLTEDEYWQMKKIFHHIIYSRHNHRNCTEFLCRLSG